MEENTKNLSTETEQVETQQIEEYTPTVEDLMAELNKQKADYAKLKKATDKATSEASEYKKKLRERMSADEQEAQAKAEAQAELEQKYNDLLKEVEVGKLKNQYLSIGYTEEQAQQASLAQMDGNVQEVFRIQAEVQKALMQKAQDEFLRSRTPVNAGVGDIATKSSMTKEEILAIKDRNVRRQKMAENPQLFNIL